MLAETVELTKDILMLERKAKHVSTFSVACSLGVRIVKLAQNSSRNVPRLHSLAHFVADHLIDIAKYRGGRYNILPDLSKENIDQLEAVLQDILRTVKKYSMHFITSQEDRDADIERLEQQLRDVKRSIITSPTTSRPQTPINYYIAQEINRPRTVNSNTRRLQGLALNRPRTTVNSRAHPRVEEGLFSTSIEQRSSSPIVSVSLLHGQVRIRSPCTSPELKDHSLSIDISLDVLGKTFNFDNQRVTCTSPFGSSSSAWSYFRKSKLESTPNLTGCIRITKGPFSGGAFCDIYLGKLTSEHMEKSVAMKMLRIFNTDKQTKAKKKFLQEVSLWRSIRHPHVLSFYGTCQYDEFRLFMVSPWAAGGNSLEFLRRNPQTDRLRLLWQASSALEYLHSGKDAPSIVHGDLKADNLLISETGDALLCDFGLSHFVEEINSNSGSSGSHVGGSPRFMAPELLMTPKGAPPTSKPTFKSDIFSFASLMLQVFDFPFTFLIYTEKLPFSDLHEQHAIIKISRGELPARSLEPLVLERGLNDHTWALMKDCWKFEPSQRPRITDVMWGISRFKLWADEKTRQ